MIPYAFISYDFSKQYESKYKNYFKDKKFDEEHPLFIMPWRAPLGGMLCWLILGVGIYTLIENAAYKLLLAKGLSIQCGCTIRSSLAALYS